ncbi:MAG: HD domain-containing protein [Candidatus Bathyarchaeia archaeon]
MSSFSEINFEPPGYPIYRAFIIPYKRDKDLYDVVEVGAKEVDRWRKMLERLRSFLSDAMGSLSENGRELRDYERIDLIGDLISLFLRAPLNREVLPSVAPSPLKAYAFMRLIGLEDLFREWKWLEFDPLGFTYAFYHRHMRKYLEESGQHSKLTKVLSELETTEVSDLLESCWLLIPADTRPILSTASLIPHLLLTSAIAWSVAINKGIENRRTVALLRLAAILHDIGKPFKYRDHVRASLEVAERLLSGLLSDEDVKAISGFIEEHHHPKTELGNIIRYADTLASAIDRLKRLLNCTYFKSIKDKLEGAARMLNYDGLDKAFDDWNFWRRIYEEYDRDLLRNLSEEFVKNIRKITKSFTTIPPEIDATKEESRDIRIVLIDVGGIQNFIYRSHSLRQVAAASLVVDSLTMAYIIAYLQQIVDAKYWLPYEAFLYTAGGNIELLVPYTLVETIKNEGSKLNDYLMKNCGISLRIADTELYENYARTVEKLMAIISINKMCVAYKEYHANIPTGSERGVRRVCQFCFIETPTTKVPTPEGELETCRTCSELNSIGLNIHFKEKYESQLSINGKVYRPKDVFNIPWDEKEAYIRASERIMEIIAGHDLSELQELGRLAEMRNIAVIKVDGALMGSLMATCLSIADAYERSARIDLALKKSIEDAVINVYNGVLKEFGEMNAARAALPIKIGILYAGGDDAVILAPSWASPLIALVLGKEFLYNLGFVRGLSIGIAVAGPKANIWSLIDASSELMRKAKSKARKKIEEGSAESTLCFDIVEIGDLSSSTINERFEILNRERLTVQPLNMEDFERILCNILNSGPEYSEIARLSYLASRNIKILEKDAVKKDDLIKRVEEIQNGLKSIGRAISETLQAAKSMIIKAEGIKQYERYIFPIAYIYTCRQIARIKNGPYGLIKFLIPDSLDAPSSLSDVDRLIRIIGGGVI